MRPAAAWPAGWGCLQPPSPGLSPLCREIAAHLASSGYARAPVRARRKVADVMGKFGVSERTAWRCLRAAARGR